MRHFDLRIATFLAILVTFTGSAVAQGPERLNVPELGRLPAFSHASLSDDLIFVSGTLGTKAGTIQIVEGGTAAETTQTLNNIEQILVAAGASRRDVVKCNVYLRDMATFGEMNEAYIAFFGHDPPARTTVGVSELALGAAVEIEAIAKKPHAELGSTTPTIPAPPETGFFETSDGERVYYEVTPSGTSRSPISPSTTGS